jgi:hypothetical protein
MLTAALLVALAQVKPGPIDAFRANLASIRASLQFESSYHSIEDPSDLVKSLEKFGQASVPAGEATHVVRGTWEFDGEAEHYILRVVGGSLGDPNGRTGPVARCELLSDGKMMAYHHLRPGETALHIATGARFPFPLVGPFVFTGTWRFDREVESEYADAEVERKEGTRAEHRTEVEIYNKSVGESRLRREVAYDPEIGYLPRFLRGIASSAENGRSTASIKELYLIEAQPCGEGGFVPMEWYVHKYHIDDFDSKYPSYDDRTRLTPSGASTLVHFKALKLEDKKGPVRLETLANVDRIYAPGGGLNGSFGPLTLDQLKSRLGNRIKPSNRPVAPSVDLAELHEFDKPPPSRWRTYLIYLILSLAVVVISGVLVFRRRHKSVVLIFLLVVAGSGCGQQPVTRLATSFSPNQLIFDPSKPSLDVGLTVNNAGNCALRIFGVTAGCSCRHVDTTRLPASLRPGDSLTLRMNLTGSRQYSPQSFMITFETDQGNLSSPASLLTLPSHHVMPPSFTLTGLHEGSDDNDHSFEVIYREVYHSKAIREPSSLIIPPEFAAEKIASEAGRIAAAPEYVLKETTYRLTLKDTSLGLHKSIIVVNGSNQRPLVEMPVVWKRSSFLSSVPERVILSGPPVRTFLQCPDHAIELTRVLSAPDGVKAVVSSTRELVLSLVDKAPGVIDGFVDVGTTSEGRPPLHIKVVRYAPSASQ